MYKIGSFWIVLKHVTAFRIAANNTVEVYVAGSDTAFSFTFDSKEVAEQHVTEIRCKIRLEE